VKELKDSRKLEVYQMSGKDYPTLEENIRVIISDVGVQTILREMTPGELEESLDQIVGKIDENALFSALIAQMGAEKISDSLPELLKALVEQVGTEKIQQLLQELSGENDNNDGR